MTSRLVQVQDIEKKKYEAHKGEKQFQAQFLVCSVLRAFGGDGLGQS